MAKQASKGAGATSASTPFSTKDGQPQGQGSTSGGGLDVLKNPTGNGDKTAPRDYVSTSDRRQVPARPVPIPNDLANQSRRQPAPIDARQRVNPTSIPSDGSTHAPAASAPAWRAGAGSIAPSGAPMGHSPMKFKDSAGPTGVTPKPAPSKASGSDSASKPLATFARKPVPGAGR